MSRTRVCVFVCYELLLMCLWLCAVVYLNKPDACYDYVVGKEDADEFDDVKVVVKEICPPWYVVLIDADGRPFCWR